MNYSHVFLGGTLIFTHFWVSVRDQGKKNGGLRTKTMAVVALHSVDDIKKHFSTRFFLHRGMDCFHVTLKGEDFQTTDVDSFVFVLSAPRGEGCLFPEGGAIMQEHSGNVLYLTGLFKGQGTSRTKNVIPRSDMCLYVWQENGEILAHYYTAKEAMNAGLLGGWKTIVCCGLLLFAATIIFWVD